MQASPTDRYRLLTATGKCLAPAAAEQCAGSLLRHIQQPWLPDPVAWAGAGSTLCLRSWLLLWQAVKRAQRQTAQCQAGDWRPAHSQGGLPSSTAAPSLRSSVQMASMRSVSLTRQLPTPLMAVGPCAACGAGLSTAHDPQAP